MYYLVFGCCAWQDGRTLSVSVYALLILSLAAAWHGTGCGAGRAGGPVVVSGVVLALPLAVARRRGGAGGADVAAAMAVGFYWGLIPGAIVLAVAGAITMTASVVLQYRRCLSRNQNPERDCYGTLNPDVNQLPFLPAVLSAQVFVHRWGTTGGCI